MAFKMKGSPHKMGRIQGTSGHTSALKQKEAEASALKDTQYFGQNTSHDEVKSVTNHNKKHSAWEKSGRKKGWDENHEATRKELDKDSPDFRVGDDKPLPMKSPLEQGSNTPGMTEQEFKKDWQSQNDGPGWKWAWEEYQALHEEKPPAKEKAPTEMKSPLEQKKKLNLKTIKEGFKGTDTEKAVKAVKNVAGKVKKFRKSLKPVKTTEVTSDNDKTTATTTKSKKKLFGGKKTTTTSTSRGKEDVDFTRGDMTTTTTRNKKKGGGKKKEVTINPTTGKKTVTRYKKDGSVKNTKVKKGEYGFKRGKSNKSSERNAIREAEKGSVSAPLEQKKEMKALKNLKKEHKKELRSTKKSKISKAKEVSSGPMGISDKKDRRAYVKQEKKAARKEHREGKKQFRSDYKTAKGLVKSGKFKLNE